MITPEAVLVRGHKITQVGEEVVRPLRVPKLVRVVKGLDFGHVNEDGHGSVISVLGTLEEEGISLVVDRAVASDSKTFLRVSEVETCGTTARGCDAKSRVVAVRSNGLTDIAEGVMHRVGEVDEGEVLNLADEAARRDE